MATSSAPSCWSCEDDDHFALLGCGCGAHHICEDCLRVAANAITTYEKSYPLKCADDNCPPMSMSLIELTLSTSGHLEDIVLLELVEAKVREYRVPREDRTYCMNENCMTAHGEPQYLDVEVYGQGNIILCPHCSSIMCQVCKATTNPPEEHLCEEDPSDIEMEKYMRSLPEEERYLTRKCYSCGVWINKTSACDHMTCDCGAQFCLCCGRRWQPFWYACRGGCPKNDAPVYDDDGFNQDGFNPATGLNREGLPWDVVNEMEDEMAELRDAVEEFDINLNGGPAYVAGGEEVDQADAQAMEEYLRRLEEEW